MNKQVYLAGDMLNKGAQMQRASEKSDIKKIGLSMYVPQDNAEINDKANLNNNDGLAEKIVKHDTDAIINSDIIVIEPLPQGLGTHIELGQVLGMFDMAHMILDIAENEEQPMIILDKIIKLAERTANKKILPHYEDIRRVNGSTETDDRRSLGINQYVYGACLKLTNGKGFYEWEEVLKELKQIKKEPTL
ncbi:nucleoside 2-deoxyribosyltransferase [Viridibacillus arvi]|uniref:nucleoside 2-deoxyribosyltransferase n=1 Tax=Viridibacillus arvi TaxID=263475 RepID=UPI0034CDA5D9